jgi:hypothetical protein
VYLSNGRVHDCETRKMLELNIGQGGMKRLMEEAAARHTKAKRAGRRRTPGFGRRYWIASPEYG